jgi:non-specific protein-tyrosine kinase
MKLITLDDPRSPVSEAYRALRTNLSFYSLDQPIRSLVVTSPAPDPHKSTTIANLGVTMAQSGRRTILVDCDLRRPSLAALFELPAEPGVTDAILEASESPALQQTSVENLWLLPSGPKPPNPADLLGSKQFDKLIVALLAKSDIILFAAPPVMAVTDATVLGAKVDGVLLVLNAGKTRRDHAEQAKQRLETANVRILGATLINAPRQSAVGDYYG